MTRTRKSSHAVRWTAATCGAFSLAVLLGGTPGPPEYHQPSPVALNAQQVALLSADRAADARASRGGARSALDTPVGLEPNVPADSLDADKRTIRAATRAAVTEQIAADKAAADKAAAEKAAADKAAAEKAAADKAAAEKAAADKAAAEKAAADKAAAAQAAARQAAAAQAAQAAAAAASRAARSAPQLTVPGNAAVPARVAPTFVPLPVTGATDPASNRALGMRMMLAHGWDMSQWAPLNSLFTRESGWSVTAASPSGAYGIPQALPGSKMGTVGSDWLTNPATQIAWGLNYIAARYGSPQAAWDHSVATGWY